MHLHALDWAIVAFTLFICFFPALFFGKLAGKNTSEFFASGRSVPDNTPCAMTSTPRPIK